MKRSSHQAYHGQRLAILSILTLSILFLVSSSKPSAAQKVAQVGWRVEIEEGQSKRSTLTINNRCSEPHLFRIKSSVNYLHFEQPADSVLIDASSNKQLAVQFDAKGLKSKEYRSTVVIECLDCRNEPQCNQDRDELAVEMTVVKSSTQASPLNQNSEETDSTRPAVAQQSWSVAIEQNAMLTNCAGATNIPVAGATDCATAKAAAWNLLMTLLQTPNCMSPGCPPGSTITQGVSTCTPDPYIRPNGSPAIRWQVSWTWNCVPPSPLSSLPCCKCLGEAVTLDLSTGQGSPIDPLWKMNGGSAYTTPPYPGWITTLAPAKWIQPVASPTPSSNVPAGVYKYKVQFNIPECTIPSNVRLDGNFAADNSAKAFLDGIPIPSASCPGPICFAAPQAPVAFSVASILPGTHTLEIDVTNDGCPSGLVVNAQLKRLCKKE